jgi:arylsulfatase A
LRTSSSRPATPHASPGNANPGLEINGVEKDYSNGEYGPDIVNDYALDFISRKKDVPFFLYYPMMLTHAPYQPTPDSPGWSPKATGENVSQNPKHFADMVEYMDKLIGKLVAKLEVLGIRDNTLILFVGDNGTGKGTISTVGGRQVSGGKGLTTDAGMHVPLIASWPAKAATGKVSGDLVDSTDFLPTICEAAGVPVPADLKIDGRSFLPQLRGEKGSPRDWYYCWYAPHKAQGLKGEFAATRDFKLYRTGEFYDLCKDLEEKQSLKVASLEGEAAAAAKLLQSALDKYKDARPSDLGGAVEPAGKGAAKGKKKRKKSAEQ